MGRWLHVIQTLKVSKRGLLYDECDEKRLVFLHDER